ncbi:hypothetical protein GGI07_003456, partial [Coemansia sp. Benny D115]
RLGSSNVADSATPAATASTASASQAADAAAEKEAKKRAKEERRRLMEIELKKKNISSEKTTAPKQMTKAQRRVLQEEQRAAKQGKSLPRDTASIASTGSGRESRSDVGSHHASAAGATASAKKSVKVDMANRIVVEDKRMHLYLHLDLSQHPPSSASAMTLMQTPNSTAAGVVEHSIGDEGVFAAGIKNSAFPPGPQVVVGMARDEYVAAATNEPVTVTIPGAAGESKCATLRDALPPFFSEPGLRKVSKPTGSMAGVEIHPEIKKVGLRMGAMEITGSNARTESVLAAFAQVISDYVSPPLTEVYRNLTQYVSTQISFLVHQRPMCIGMGNAIRWLKLEISKIPVEMKDEEAKRYLIKLIGEYVQERITVAGDFIAEAGAQKIQDGDVVLTYGSSSTVQRLLQTAHKMGRRFRVIVIDSRPQSEGLGLVRKLVEDDFADLSIGADSADSASALEDHSARGKGRGRNGMDMGITYAPITSLSFLMREASKVFLGAEAFFANGTMLSRSGTAMVALAAHSYHVPVIVACETYKFSERIQIDAVVNNELGLPDTLMYKPGVPDAQPVGPQSDQSLSYMEYSAYARDRYSARPRWNNRNTLAESLSKDSASNSAAKGKGKGGRAAAPVASVMTPEMIAAAQLKKNCPLSDWRTTNNLRLLNLTQDLTPPEFVTVIITEVGMIPTTSIPVVLREYKNQI